MKLVTNCAISWENLHFFLLECRLSFLLLYYTVVTSSILSKAYFAFLQKFPVEKSKHWQVVKLSKVCQIKTRENIIWRMTMAPERLSQEFGHVIGRQKSTNEIVSLSRFRPYSYWARNEVSEKPGVCIKTLWLVAAKANAFVKPIIWKKVFVTFIYYENKWYINVLSIKKSYFIICF